MPGAILFRFRGFGWRYKGEAVLNDKSLPACLYSRELPSLPRLAPAAAAPILLIPRRCVVSALDFNITILLSHYAESLYCTVRFTNANLSTKWANGKGLEKITWQNIFLYLISTLFSLENSIFEIREKSGRALR